MLRDLIFRIEFKYKNSKNEWIIKTVKKYHYFDGNGREITDDILALLRNEAANTTEEEYEISEGDTDNYGESTAANAIIPLKEMLSIASDHLSDKNAVWDGD